MATINDYVVKPCNNRNRPNANHFVVTTALQSFRMQLDFFLCTHFTYHQNPHVYPEGVQSDQASKIMNPYPGADTGILEGGGPT